MLYLSRVAIAILILNLVLSTICTDANAQADSVCASVRLQLSQNFTLTRTAFKATLKVDNTGENSPLDNFQVSLSIKTENGQVADTLFVRSEPELTGISTIDGSASLISKTSATVTWNILPLRDAALRESTVYYVTGDVQYTQDDVSATIPLLPVSIVVKPDPCLVMRYFWQHEVYSDDPFTAYIEPAEPFALGVLVSNQGGGTARQMKMTAPQLNIIDNEKGLLVDFELLDTQVNDQSVDPALNIDFGDIMPDATTVAVWRMVSSLQGEFKDFEASFEHLDGLGDRRLSLVDSVSMHKLNHVVRIDSPTDDGRPDFLVDDLADKDELPDIIYSSDGTTTSVVPITNATIEGNLTQDHLSVKLSAVVNTGWNYIRVADPGGSQYELTKVLRTDGREIRFDDNAWTTHRSIHKTGLTPYREDLLHILDRSGTGSYTLIYNMNETPVQASIDVAKELPDGKLVHLGYQDELFVTSVFPDCFYVERSDRVSGIRVQSDEPVVTGWKVSISGITGTNANMERYIQSATALRCSDTIRPVQPLIVTCKSLGGDEWRGQHSTQAYQWILENNHPKRSEIPLPVSGLNNIGLLVRIAGRVASADASAGVFYLDDGANFDEFAYPNVLAGYPPGVRVQVFPVGADIPKEGSNVIVTGVSSCYMLGSNVMRMLRVADAGDIQTL